MDVWNFEQRCAEVDAIRDQQWAILQEMAQNRALASRATLAEPQATEAQLELFSLLGREGFDHVENLIAKLPSLRLREHFRRLYLREYHSVADDGSIAWDCGNKQAFYANRFLRELLEKRLDKVFAQYQFDLEWLALPMADKWAWAQNEAVKLGAVDVETGIFRTREADKKKQKLPFYLMSEAKLQSLADHLSFILSKIQTDYFTKLAESGREFSARETDLEVINLYRFVGGICEQIGLALPYWRTFAFSDGDKGFKPNVQAVEIALNKAVCEKFWLKQLKKAQKQMVEHLAIACGEVRKGVAAYVSQQGFNAWKAQRKKNYDFLRSQIVVNIDNESEQAELFEMYLKSSANPAIRHKEMMNCLRGIEEWAQENEHQALFLTLTAPSSFHAQHSKGGQNGKWSGASPKQTQAYLNTVWAQFRALLKKRGIAFYGMRVAEPHHDATPHWHLLMYVNQKDVDEVTHLFRQKALELDGEEAGAKKHRCKVEKCDPKKGSATAYIVKYISKNLGGIGLPSDDEKYQSDEVEGLSFKDNASRVRAWASLWGIRQFQFYGVSSIGVWRELRRLTSGQIQNDKALEELRLGADIGDYAFYLAKMGGGGAPRKEWGATLVYEEKEPNKYGEISKRIIGIRGHLEEVKSRTKQWRLERKTAVRSTAQNTGHSPAWTCVSNCNPSSCKGSGADTVEKVGNYLRNNAHKLERLKMALGWRGLNAENYADYHFYFLLNGGEMRLTGADFMRFDGNEVQILRKN